MRKSIILLVAILIFCIILAGCGSGPSDGTIAASVEAQLVVGQTETAEAVPTETPIPTRTPSPADIELDPDADAYLNRGSAQTETQPVDIYKDRNGYFAVLVPRGWEQRDFPSETIRSKVSFYHPSESEVGISIIVALAPAQDYSLDALYSESQQNIDGYLRKNYPSGEYNLRRDEIGEHPAIVVRSSIPEFLEQETMMTITNGLVYSISFSAQTGNQFDNYDPTFQRLLQGFVILETGRSFSDEEIRASQVARYRRLAELHEQQGLIQEALAYAKEGLAIAPDDAELKELELRLQSK